MREWKRSSTSTIQWHGTSAYAKNPPTRDTWRLDGLAGMKRSTPGLSGGELASARTPPSMALRGEDRTQRLWQAMVTMWKTRSWEVHPSNQEIAQRRRRDPHFCDDGRN